MGILTMLGTNLRIFRRLTCVAFIVIAVISGSALAQEPNPKELLARMSAEIAKLDSFVLSGDAYADASLGEGQIIEHSYDATMRVRKPSELRLTNENAEFTGEIFFENGVLTVFNAGRNFYAKKPIPDGFENAVNFALNDLGIKAPLLELITKDFAELVSHDDTDVEYLGASLFRGVRHDHIAVRGPEIDMQLWIAAEGRPLPRKFALSYKWEVGAPRFVAFMEWDTSPKFSSDSFTFTPPDGATEIHFIPEL